MPYDTTEVVAHLFKISRSSEAYRVLVSNIPKYVLELPTVNQLTDRWLITGFKIGGRVTVQVG